MINDFMIQIIRHLGGGEKELGYSNFLQAILELPVMALIGFVLKKISSGKMLIFSGAWLLKCKSSSREQERNALLPMMLSEAGKLTVCNL